MQTTGEIKGKIIELKFPISGKIQTINIGKNTQVKKDQLLALLEQTELQAYLDRALKQYERQRAEFDQKQTQNLDQYEKRKIQDELDIAVKNVEIAKINLEATNLYSPTDALVLELDQIEKGVNISPSLFVVTLLDLNSFYFEAKVSEEEITKVKEGQKANVRLKAFPDKTIEGKVAAIGFQKDKNDYYPVDISLTTKDNLRLNLTGTVIFE